MVYLSPHFDEMLSLLRCCVCTAHQILFTRPLPGPTFWRPPVGGGLRVSGTRLALLPLPRFVAVYWPCAFELAVRRDVVDDRLWIPLADDAAASAPHR